MHDMAHQHAHLVRRQRVVIETAVVQVTRTAGDDEPEETSKGVQLPPPETIRRPNDDDEATTTADKPRSTRKPTTTATARKPSSTQDADDEKTAEEIKTAKSSPTKAASTLMVATKSPTTSPASTVAGLASVTASISATASSSAAAGADEGGMSTGAKAGLALGILLGMCALLTGILLVYRRKKKQMAAENAQNEKTEMYNAPAPPPSQVMAAAPLAASMHSPRTMTTAPRLSLRPGSQFDPAFNEQSKNGANLLGAAAAGGVVTKSQSLSPSASAERPTSAWERRGASNATTANPFNDPGSRSGPPSANPFGNKAAVDAQQASIPDSPPNASPMASAMHSTKPSTDFANPAPAIAAADKNAVALAGAMSSIPPPTSELPLPPVVTANAGSVPPSPAWTEDIPASPGPAPTGPPPVAGVMAGSRPQSPAPGPNNVHRVQLDFKASMQDELDLHAGQIVRMLHEYDDGWVSLGL
jgi:LPXTG-motif cell wall-anchored protein